LNIDALTEKKYFCIFNTFAFGCIEKRYSYYLNQKYILSALAIMCNDEINKALISFENIQKQKAEAEKERLEQERLIRQRQTKTKIDQLAEKILNDEIFAHCSSEKDRLSYLRTLLEKEPDDVITYLEMKRLQTGKVQAQGIKGKQFINNIWKTLNNKA
jgi:hypothetical protein